MPIPKSVHTKSYQTLLELLRAAREETGLTQRDLAKRLKIGQSVISKCENGERQLNVVELRVWCAQGLGLNWIEFLSKFDALLDDDPEEFNK